jgi:hypothetical protein
MSGSSGDRDDSSSSSGPKNPRTGGGGGGGGGGGAEDCDLVQTAPLNSPQRAVVSTLSVGAVLEIALTGAPPRQILEVQTSTGAVAGTLTHRGHLQIIDCINQGHSYEAIVVSISGGFVTVRVQRA